MEESQNQNLKHALLDFCKCSIQILFMKQKSESSLHHISGTPAKVDEQGMIIDTECSFQRISDQNIIYFIMMHGDLPDFPEFIRECWNVLKVLPEYDTFRIEMEKDPEVARHLDYIVGALDRAASHDVEFFTKEFLEELLNQTKGIRFVDKCFNDVYTDFEDFLYHDTVPYTTFVAIWGFHQWQDSKSSVSNKGLVQGSAVLTRKRMDNLHPIQLTKRAKIVPTGLSSIHKHINIQGGFLSPESYTWDFSHILELSGTTRKKFKGSKKRKSDSSSQILENEILKLVGAMRLYKEGDVQYAHLGSVTRDWFRKFGKRSLKTPQRPMMWNTCDLSSTEEKDLKKFCKWFTTTKYIEPLELAMKRFNMSYERPQFKDTLIDLMIAFEALLVQREKKGIGATIARRVANLIADSDEERQNIFDEIHDAYYVRSKIVHGDQNKEVVGILESKGKPMIWFVKDVQEILRRMLREYVALVKKGQTKIEIIEANDRKVKGRPRRKPRRKKE
ncbi:MAG: hypothetical protein ACTSR9_11855 [Candidatus Thorarchaeota archaeon]